MEAVEGVLRCGTLTLVDEYRPLALAYILLTGLIPLQRAPCAAVATRLSLLTPSGRALGDVFRGADVLRPWVAPGWGGGGSWGADPRVTALPAPAMAATTDVTPARAGFSPAAPWIAAAGVAWDGVACPICGALGHSLARCPAGPAGASPRWFEAGKTWDAMGHRPGALARGGGGAGTYTRGRGASRGGGAGRGGHRMTRRDSVGPASGGAGGGGH
jgi:hypothetical protein